MRPRQTTPETVNEYIADFPPNVQGILQKIRMIIKEAAPDAEETISYNIPTFHLNGRYLIYFAAYKKHIALYPVPPGDAKFNAEVSAYQKGKGTLQFPLDKPMPFQLIARTVKFSLKENLARGAKTKKQS